MSDHRHSLEELQAATLHANLDQQLKGFAGVLFLTGGLLITLTLLGPATLFGVGAMVVAGGWMIIFAGFILKRTVITAPKVAYGVLGGLMLLGPLLQQLEMQVAPPAAGQVAHSSIIIWIEAIPLALFLLIYQRRLKLFPAAPSADVAAWLSTVLASLSSAEAVQQQDVIEFKISSDTMYSSMRARLLDDMVVLKDMKTGTGNVVAKKDFHIVPRSNPDIFQQAILQLQDQRFPLQIKPEMIARVERWQSDRSAQNAEGLWVPPAV